MREAAKREARAKKPLASIVTDGGRYRTIGSLQPLAVAMIAALVTSALLWLAL